MNAKKKFLAEIKEISFIFPTIFNIFDIWKLNSSRCNGKFNLIFFWLYPILLPYLLIFTILCLLEWACTSK